MLRPVATTLIALGTLQCTIQEPELDTKTCPCAAGFSCDEERNVCVQGSLPGATGAIAVSNLGADWATPNQIRWSWHAQGNPKDLFRFELVVGESEQDVLDRTGTAVVWTREQNPELGEFLLPNTGGGDPVIRTTTFGHEPSVDYYAQLVAVDTQQRQSTSGMASETTQGPPATSLTIFEDTLASGQYPAGDIPPTLSTEHPHSGTHCVALVNACQAQMSCFQQFGVAGFNKNTRVNDVGKPMLEGALDTTAYYEFAVSNEGEQPAFWAQFRIGQGEAGAVKYYFYSSFTIRAAEQPGDYRVYQVPLNELMHNQEAGKPITWEDMAAPLRSVQIGGMWGEAATVRLDSVYLHW